MRQAWTAIWSLVSLILNSTMPMVNGVNHLTSAFEEGCEAGHILVSNANQSVKIDQLQVNYDFEKKKAELQKKLGLA